VRSCSPRPIAPSRERLTPPQVASSAAGPQHPRARSQRSGLRAYLPARVLQQAPHARTRHLCPPALTPPQKHPAASVTRPRRSASCPRSAA
jgi:hypothetical protein